METWTETVICTEPETSRRWGEIFNELVFYTLQEKHAVFIFVVFEKICFIILPWVYRKSVGPGKVLHSLSLVRHSL